ncbi:hypothetical protein WQ53_07560 [Pseudoxanthomonas suwonensis]|uniref:DUF4175 domain-containing protein n=1 Tax=Pseudoxanthomonas suwonensis TaxID=314722 RepID=A0A0E3Z509_9GAMM|nr:hypothetical protein WQ53_07560 [Pseudoxanthomonas suwonensis]
MPFLPHRLLRQAQRRGLAIDLAFVVPVLLAMTSLAWRLGGTPAAIAIATLAAAIAGIQLIRRWRRHDATWLVRRLNDERAGLEDSADLLLADAAALPPLPRLQQQRLWQRLRADPPDLRRSWPWRRLLPAVALPLAVAVLALGWPPADPLPAGPTAAVAGRDAVVPAPPPQRIGQQLRVQPPAHTGLPERSSTDLQAQAPQDSRLHWSLRYDRTPEAVALVFHDGRRLPLRLHEGAWHADAVLTESVLYRIEADGAADDAQRLYRLDAIPDRPPQVRVLQPDRSLSLATPGQRHWDVAFEASDDYGVAAAAQLRVVLAQGSGENIAFRESRIALAGSGEPVRKRFAHRLDLAALGFAEGDDLVVQLVVADNRRPRPHEARSPSLILRWQAGLGAAPTGIEAVVRQVLPAYFRSQRQIIIDAEALQKRKPALGDADFVKRSDAIGVDQRILRLRYGQFLGEETEGAPRRPPLPTDDAGEEHHDDDGHDHGRSAATADLHDHGHDDDPGQPQVFGRQEDVLAEYGHTHDHAEAATLLDPETRAILKQALDQMWQSELHLRQGRPDQALPYAYKALDFIKQVQQASRIYLARVGPQLPPIDEGRRLGGKRDGIAPRAGALQRRDDADAAAIESLWRALGPQQDGSDGSSITDSLDGLEAWLRQHPDRAPDALSLYAAIDALRRQPDCADCRTALRGLLWPLLPRPPAATLRRDDGDAQGRRYLDALRREEQR